MLLCGCSVDDSDARWEFEDSFPEIVPGACDELLEASEGRPSVEQVDEDTWALHFEPFEQDCAVYQNSLMFRADASRQPHRWVAQDVQICNRCNEDQVFDTVSYLGRSNTEPDEILVTGVSGEQITNSLTPLLGFGQESEPDMRATCYREQPWEVAGDLPGRYVHSVRLNRYPQRTGQTIVIHSGGFDIEETDYGRPGRPVVTLGPEVYLRAFWPRLRPVDAPLDPMVTAHASFMCDALGWEAEPGAEIIMPGEYRPEEAYWEAPVQRFELPEALLEWLEQ